MKYLAPTLIGTLLMSGAALAQSPAPSATPAPAMQNSAAMTSNAGWRASKLSGVDVYNDANEKIGDINDVILDKTGKATTAIIGVGGFLGAGEHYVAIGFDKLKFSDQPVRDTTASSSTSNRTTTGAATGTSASTSSGSSKANWYPDHAVFNATKDQLKAMPQFEY
jgi:sporulation protein YlmC with PRC-barrel domain